MRPKAEWAIDSEPIRARGIIVKYIKIICILVLGFVKTDDKGNTITETPSSVQYVNSPQSFNEMSIRQVLRIKVIIVTSY